jgi:hypothetical protein
MTAATESDGYYNFRWPSPSGVCPITQLGFTLKFTSEDAELKFTEGMFALWVLTPFQLLH